MMPHRYLSGVAAGNHTRVSVDGTTAPVWQVAIRFA
jgi:hypothetical protein